VRVAVERKVGRGANPPGAPIQFTPRAKKVLELALREALELGHRSYLGTEHILLGLVREGEGVAAEVLQELDVTLDRVRAAVLRLLNGTSEPPDVSGIHRLSEPEEP
jgi:ATP-dependent Clp protease ATP-binding subunit ClpC